jgi:hypothetical protein
MDGTIEGDRCSLSRSRPSRRLRKAGSGDGAFGNEARSLSAISSLIARLCTESILLVCFGMVRSSQICSPKRPRADRSNGSRRRCSIFALPGPERLTQSALSPSHSKVLVDRRLVASFGSRTAKGWTGQ